ncbi:hypothetical protein [Geitlerinema sp. PCC 9228]|nr:hypothetical protein [Geitlerinema sp. PCC 9228]
MLQDIAFPRLIWWIHLEKRSLPSNLRHLADFVMAVSKQNQRT